MVIYVPGTEEKDPKKVIMSLQQIGPATSTNTTSIVTNTADIVTNTAAIAALNAATYVNSFKARTGVVVPVQGDYPTSLIPGTTTNDSATAGNIGEFISSTIAAGSAVTLTTATSANITSISLTAGDWDVSAVGYVVGTGSPTITFFEIDITQTTTTSPGNVGAFVQIVPATPLTVIQSATIPLVRQSLSGTTTIFLTAIAGFSGGTNVKAYGFIGARRVR